MMVLTAPTCSALVLTKVYTNTLMMLLNNRTQMRTMIGGQVWVSGEGDVEMNPRSQHSRRRSAVPHQVALRRFPSQERESVGDAPKKGDAQSTEATGMSADSSRPSNPTLPVGSIATQ